MGENDNNKRDKDEIIVYQFNDELAEFEELELDEDVKLYELLDPSFVLLFLDPKHYKAWLWQGSEVSTRMKFISAKLAPEIRDRHGIAMKIVTADEGNEPLAFKIMVGLEEEIDYTEEQTGPAYKGTEEDKKMLELVGLEQIILLLEKVAVPEGYKRELVLVNGNLYKYTVKYIEYMGEVVEEKNLIPLEEKVPDGPYLADKYVPRFLFSFNRVVLTEFLRKLTPEEIEEEKRRKSILVEAVKKLKE